MATIKYIQDKKGNTLYPITEEDAVITNEGTSLSEKLSDLGTIRANAALGSTAYQKPSTGIPSSDLDAATRALLNNMVLYGDQVETLSE